MPRIIVDLSAGWTFVRRRMGRSWINGRGEPSGVLTDLPHSWNDRDTFQDGVEYYRGPGSYRRLFVAPAENDRRWRLRSEGFYGVGEVRLDGRRLARVDGQYLGFDLDAELRPGAEHRLGIRLTNRCSRSVLPGLDDPDFILHGGLAGRIWLEGRALVQLPDDAWRVRVAALSPERARIVLEASVDNLGEIPSAARVSAQLLGPDGRLAAEGRADLPAVAPRKRAPALIELELAAPRLWSLDQPERYVVDLSVESPFGRDGFRRRIGLRTAEFRPDEGFFLNGERVEWRGCNRHESMPGFGQALPHFMHRRDAESIRAMGCNAVRLSHYPQHPAFLDACDELGIMVYAELASWKSVRGGRWLRNAGRQLEAMIRRDAHHPSVMLWGLGNEARHRRAYVQLGELARRLDPARPVIYAENHIHRARRTLGLTDVWGCNYELDRLAEGRDAARLRAVLVSECSNAPYAVRGRLDAGRGQVRQIEGDLAAIAGRPYVAGFLLWCFNDYPTLRKKRYFRCCGLVDPWRVPKMSADLLRAMYAKPLFVAAHADWSRPAAGESTPRRLIDVFTNASEIEVCAGARILFQGAAVPHHTLETPFEDADLVVRVRRGAERAEQTLPPHGAAVRLAMGEEDRPEPGWVILCIRALDCEGRLDARWEGRVGVVAEGAVARTYTEAGEVLLSGGSGRLFLEVSGDRPVRVEVRAPGLASAHLELPLPAGTQPAFLTEMR